MRIPIDRDSQTPMYQQVIDFLREEIRSGALPLGARLPSTRELAESIGVNRITVTNAYAELAAEGLIYTRLGSGTFVAESNQEDEDSRGTNEKPRQWPMWQTRLAQQSRFTSQRTLDSYPLASTDDMINFSLGVGAEDLFPIDDFRKTMQSVLGKEKHEALGYGASAGYLPLRATIAQILSGQGIPTHPENVIITSGSQQALWLVVNLLLRPGDTVLVESPTYAGTLNLFRALDVHIASVPVDEEGMQVEKVEEILRTAHPGLIYTIPTFQNPTGTCMSSVRRRQLISLAGRYNIPILEDEFVGDLRYEGHSQPALKALDPDGRVIYISTFSKMLMPGLRVGYIVANGPVYEQILCWKRLNDIATSNLMQRALEAYITVGRYQTHLHRACRVYRQHRDRMSQALSWWMPPGTGWNNPEGGLFTWVELPGGLFADDLYPVAMEEGVQFTPGTLFFPDSRPSAYIRLNFACVSEEKIEEGIRRLGRAVQRCLDGSGAPVASTVPEIRPRSQRGINLPDAA